MGVGCCVQCQGCMGSVGASLIISYMYPDGVNVSATSPSFSNKFKGKGRKKGEDDDESDLDHQTLHNTIILN